MSDLLATLRQSLNNSTAVEFVYHTEYLGYLPFGLYHWIAVDGDDVSLSIPIKWNSEDIDVLERAGLIEKTSNCVNPEDELETATAYSLQS